MSFFHVGERLCAAPQHMCRVIVLDFPDEWLPPRRPAPDNDVIFFIDVAAAAAHVTSNLTVRNLLSPPKALIKR
jgi:hypothetical protein